VRILRVDDTGGQGGANTAPAPSKSKGKVVWTIHNYDEVLFDDDIPVQRWMRASNSSRSVASSPPIMGHQAIVVAIVPPLNPSTAMSSAMALGGIDGSSATVDSVVVERDTTEKEAANDVAVAKRVMNDVTVMKKAVDDVVMAKRTADNTTAAKKATDDTAVVKMAVDDAAVVKRTMNYTAATKKAAGETAAVKKAVDNAVVGKRAADDTVATKKAAEDTAGSDSSSALVVISKRAAAPSGSTPLAMRPFFGSWKPRYVT
jgi:hypothetical protein